MVWKDGQFFCIKCGHDEFFPPMRNHRYNLSITTLFCFRCRHPNVYHDPPGQRDAIAAINPNGISFTDCPTIKTKGKTQPNPTLMASELKRLATPGAILIIEQVHALPGQGVTSMFNFGMGYGAWLGAIAALGIPHELVSPQTWKKQFCLGSDKEASRVVALQLFPSVATELKLKKHHGRAEALLLAEYLRRKLTAKTA